MIMTTIPNSANTRVDGYDSVVARVCLEELLDDAIDRHDLNLREQAHRALDLLDDQRLGHHLHPEQQNELDVAVELGRTTLCRHVRRPVDKGRNGDR